MSTEALRRILITLGMFGLGVLTVCTYDVFIGLDPEAGRGHPSRYHAVQTGATLLLVAGGLGLPVAGAIPEKKGWFSGLALLSYWAAYALGFVVGLVQILGVQF